MTSILLLSLGLAVGSQPLLPDPDDGGYVVIVQRELAPLPVIEDGYQRLLSRVRAGERVRVASSVPAPAGFEVIEIPGETGLFECFEEAGKPMMRPIVKPMISQRIVLQEACFT